MGGVVIPGGRVCERGAGCRWIVDELDWVKPGEGDTVHPVLITRSPQIKFYSPPLHWGGGRTEWLSGRYVKMNIAKFGQTGLLSYYWYYCWMQLRFRNTNSRDIDGQFVHLRQVSWVLAVLLWGVEGPSPLPDGVLVTASGPAAPPAGPFLSVFPFCNLYSLQHSIILSHSLLLPLCEPEQPYQFFLYSFVYTSFTLPQGAVTCV